MKIKQITDNENLIRSSFLSRLGDYDYRLVIILNGNLPTYHQASESAIVLQQFEYRGLNRTIQIARIDLENAECYDWYVYRKDNVLAIIFYNNMKTRLLDEENI